MKRLRVAPTRSFVLVLAVVACGATQRDTGTGRAPSTRPQCGARGLLRGLEHTLERDRRREGYSGAVFDLTTNTRRPEGRTSADAAGLPVFPGLVRYDEAGGPGEITHAFHCNLWSTNGHVWPASHSAAWTPGAPPLGARLRLKASVDLGRYPPMVRWIFRAMQVYGLIVSDNGGCGLGIAGTMDPRWDTPRSTGASPRSAWTTSSSCSSAGASPRGRRRAGPASSQLRLAVCNALPARRPATRGIPNGPDSC